MQSIKSLIGKWFAISIIKPSNRKTIQPSNWFRRKHRGLTLVELIIAIMIMSFVVVALFSIYISVIKLFNRQRGSIDASSQTRLALDDITNSIKQAEQVANCQYPYIYPYQCIANPKPTSCTNYTWSSNCNPAYYTNTESTRTYPYGCTTSCTSVAGTGLVLALWPLDLSSNPVSYSSTCAPNSTPLCYYQPDWIVYYVDNNKNLFKETILNRDNNYAASSRKEGRKIIATNITSTTFNPNGSDFAPGTANTTSVTVTITAAGAVGGYRTSTSSPPPAQACASPGAQQTNCFTRSDSARLRNKAPSGFTSYNFPSPDTTNEQSPLPPPTYPYVLLGYGTARIKLEANNVVNGNIFNHANVECFESPCSINNGKVYSRGSITGASNFVFNPNTSNNFPANPNPVPQPILNPAEFESYWKGQAAVQSAGNTTITSSQNLGPIKIDGNLIVRAPATLSITGPIHITGYLLVDEGAKLVIASNQCSAGTVIIVDTNIQIQGGATVEASQTSPKKYLLLYHNNTAGQDLTIRANSRLPATSVEAILYSKNRIYVGGATTSNYTTTITGVLVGGTATNNAPIYVNGRYVTFNSGQDVNPAAFSTCQ